MASIILSSAGSAIGSSFGGPIGAFIGKAVGSFVGNAIDNQIFGARRLPDAFGSRLGDLSVQTSSYGKVIPIVYGTARIAGNIIWSLPIKESVTTKKVTGGGKGGGGKVSQKQTTYTYSVTMAIAICEGEIDGILRVWADSELIDPNKGTYRVYKGTETQNPDSIIESYQGVGKTPAYRGTAYVVIEDFPLANYGNRIPNFTFEVKKRAKNSSEQTLEEKIKSVVMIPASGEFAYDTTIINKIGGEDVGSQFVQKGGAVAVNQNNRSNKADAVIALDQLKMDLPNVEWISVVVGWFGDNLNAGSCNIMPGVEYKTGGSTKPEIWTVGSFNRSSAHLITQVSGSPIYGGTPDDQSVIRYVTELRNRGYKILFYPFLFMDTSGKPWRGRITGTSSEVQTFFTKTNGYNDFITHYANLLNGKVDAFCIGSEMIGITGVKDGSNNFPAVSKLVTLAATVKGILGSGAKVTYAADWGEYHHTTGGWYNLDPLWASPNIDVIGIDAYFPLADEPQSDYDRQKIIDGWTNGEGYDWYYTDVGRTTKANLTPQTAWKNIDWFWKNYHVNPNGSTTSWVPESKKIWFTEYGFPSVDGCANEPNVFYDPTSSESKFPRFSNGRVDFIAQRTAIDGTIEKWKSSSFVENMFLWTWDARPYPFYPELRKIWADGNLWQYGHWVMGKLGLSELKSIAKDLCEKCNLDEDKIDLSQLAELCEGFVINGITTGRAALEQLQKGYFFDVAESVNKLAFIPRTSTKTVTEISYDELIPVDGVRIKIKRDQEVDLPKKIDVTYLDRSKDYQVSTQSAVRYVTDSENKDVYNLAMVLNEWQAKKIADTSLYAIWAARESYEFALPTSYAFLDPSDVVRISDATKNYFLRITETLYGLNGEIRVKAKPEQNEIYETYQEPKNEGTDLPTFGNPADSKFEILDLPALPSDAENELVIRFAVTKLGSNWSGAGVYNSDDNINFSQISEAQTSSVLGVAATVLPVGALDVFDIASTVDVILQDGELESVTKTEVLNGANLALMGDEIVQFQNASLVADKKYQLSGFLRGRFGTECAISSHALGERFVLLNETIIKEKFGSYLVGSSKYFKAVSFGMSLSDVAAVSQTLSGKSLKPLSPVQIYGSRDGSGNLLITWKRRTRIGGEFRDLVDVPLAEESEKYEIDVMNGANVVRTISATTPTATYSAAQQVTDFGSAQSSLTVKIYQISAVVGRGTCSVAII